MLRKIQGQMASHVLLSDTQSLESKHSGKYISSFLYDVGQIQGLISTGVLNPHERFTLITLMFVMFYQNWEASTLFNHYDAIGCFLCKILG